MKEAFLGAINQFLRTLAQSGAKAAARAVDSVLEDVDDRADELKEHIRAGRKVAQRTGARQTRKVQVDAKVVDAVIEEEDKT